MGGDRTDVTRRRFHRLVAGTIGGAALSGRAAAQGNESGSGGFFPPPQPVNGGDTDDSDDGPEAPVSPTPDGRGAAVEVSEGGQFVANFSSTALGDATDESGIALESLSGSVTGAGSLTVSESPGEGVEPLSDDGNDVLRYITVEESGDTDTRNATFTFRVRADSLEQRGIAPENVALYRNDGSGWSPLETDDGTPVRNGQAYRYTASSPEGFSTFAVTRDGIDTSGDDTTTTTEPTTTEAASPGRSAPSDAPFEAAFGGDIAPLVAGSGVLGLAAIGGLYLLGESAPGTVETDSDEDAEPGAADGDADARSESDGESAAPDESEESHDEPTAADADEPPATDSDSVKVDDIGSLAASAESFAAACPAVETLDSAATDGLLHTFEGTLTTGADAVFRVVSPEADPEGVADEFESAVRSWQSIDGDEGVISVLDSGAEPRPWVAHEPLPGSLLSECLDAPLGERVRAVASVCETIRNAGRYNVRHRNLSPETVHVTESGSVAISGWGVERVVREHADADAPPTRYMAPEEVGDGPVGPATDVYQAGALAYHAVTGEPPFADTPDDELVAAIREELPTPPGEIDPELSAFDSRLREAMASDPAERYTSPHHLRRGLLAAL